MFNWSLRSPVELTTDQVVDAVQDGIWAALKKQLPERALEGVNLSREVDWCSPRHYRQNSKGSELQLSKLRELKAAFEGFVFVPIDRSPGELLIA